MKYEPCAGQCYAYSDVMRIHTLGLDVQGAVVFLQRLLAIHEPSCGNSEIQYRLDADEFTRSTGASRSTPDTRFVASFYHYGALDLFAGDSPREAIDAMIDAALAYYASEQFEVDRAKHGGGLGHDVCEHGQDRKLVDFALAFSGLGEADQMTVRKMVSA